MFNYRDSYGRIHYYAIADDGNHKAEFEVTGYDEEDAYETALDIAAIDYGLYAPDTDITLDAIEPDWFNQL